MIINLLNNAYARLYSKNINTLGVVKSVNIQSILIRSFSSYTANVCSYPHMLPLNCGLLKNIPYQVKHPISPNH